MSKRQTDLELMRRDCKARFRAHPTGACTYGGQNIVHDMARHVSSFHLDCIYRSIVEVPGVLVHTVEGHSTGLYRSHPQETQCG